MNWYTAECVFRSVHHGGSAKGRQLLERRYFLLKADDDESANKKARKLAKNKQHSYSNPDGIRVKWVLERVVDVKQILAKKLSEGTEVYYEYFHRQSPRTRRK
jgi:hypothetical protein